jgi:tripartite-type tricarboxylate transporter receptor subunit TctC
MRYWSLSSVLLLALVASAHAQTYPSKPIRFITGGGPGSGIDLVARSVGETLSKSLGQPVIIDPRTGAGGTIAGQFVLSNEPDGHTVLLQASGQVAYNAIYPNLGYDTLRDFSGVTPLAILPTVMVAPAQRNWKSVRDVIAAAKSKPGSLNYASAGNGSATHMSAERFRMQSGIVAQHVPYKSSPDAITETMAGRIDWFFSPLGSALPLIKDGRIHAIALSSPRRSPQLPDLPTLAEQGLKDADYKFWVGMLVSSKTPRAIVQRLNTEAVAAVQTAPVRERFATIGADAFTMKPEEFDAFLRSESEVAAAIVKAGDIRVQ